MPDENLGPVKKHITTACTCCRRRKVKCDGVAPTCSNCRLYKQECKYNYGEDRRKISPKKQIQKLSARAKLLERLLHSNGIPVPPESESSDTTPPNESTLCAISNPRMILQDEQQIQNDFRSSDTASMSETGVGMAPVVSPIDWMSGFETEYPTSSTLPPVSPPSQHMFMPFPGNGQMPLSMSNGGIQLMTGLRGCNPLATTIVFDDDDPSSSINISMLDPATLNRRCNNQPRRQSSIEWHNDNSWSNHHTRNASTSNRDKGNIAPVELDQSTDMIEQLSARLGSFQIAEDGQLRYFGATSNLHILHNGGFSLSRTPTRSIRREGKIALQRAELDLNVERDFERHLEKLYFTWEDPAIHVVDEEMYYREQEKYESGLEGTPFYSETLKNAILAVGANLTPRARQGLLEPVPEFFSARAKVLLDIELDSPTVATVQALVIMSASEAAFTRDARGWIYSGMAVRLSADLGLHLDLSSHVEDGRLTTRELDVRRTTFWGVFVHDNMWSLYVGRPWGINIRDISISRPPRENDRIKNKLWKPYTDGDGSFENDKTGLFDPVEACADATISLCEMMRRLSRTLYAGRCLSSSELQLFASDMRQEFSRWHSSLPPDLAVPLPDPNVPKSTSTNTEKTYLPHVLQLHMQFYAVSIFLHRPFFSQQSESNNTNKSSSYHHAAQRSCVEAAQAMVSLLRMYREQHTLRQTNVQIVHLLFTAALIHVYNNISVDSTSGGRDSPEREKTMEDLQFCCTALGEIGVAWRNATRALEVIICIKREWQSSAAVAARAKRKSEAVEELEREDGMRKRRATIEQSQLSKMERDIVTGAGKGNGNEEVQDQEHAQNEWQFLDPAGEDFGMNLNMNINELGDSFPIIGGFRMDFL